MSLKLPWPTRNKIFLQNSSRCFQSNFSLSDYESAAEAAEATDTDNDLSFEGERERDRMLFMFWFVFPVQVLGFQPESSAEFLIYWRISTSRTTPRTLRPRWRVSSYRSVGSVGTHLCSSVMSHFANILRDFHHHMCLFYWDQIKLRVRSCTKHNTVPCCCWHPPWFWCHKNKQSRHHQELVSQCCTCAACVCSVGAESWEYQ